MAEGDAEVLELEQEADRLDARKSAQIRDAVSEDDAARLTELMEPLHPADIADLLEQLDTNERLHLVRLYGREFDGEILSELGEGVREEVIEALQPDVLQDAVRELESDDVVDLLEDLEEEQHAAILQALHPSDRIAIERALSYPEHSAGRLMQREVVAAPEHWRVGQVIDFMRAHEDLPEQFYHVILVDPAMRPVGYVTLGKIMSSRREVRLSDVTEPSFRTFRVDDEEEEVAYAFNQYHLISAPVVDDAGRLAGVVTIDDAMIVQSEEAEEDMRLLAGVGEETLQDTTIEIVRRRFPWLAVNLATAILASFVIAQFDETIAAIVALAVLMPIVASMGGNAATQSLTVAVRALATRDLTGSNTLRVIRREVVAGFINGMMFAVIMGTIEVFWFGSPMLGLVIGAAMIINLVCAGLAGIGVPIVLEKLGIDPALASGTFVTTVTDVVGFFSFLGLAGIVLL
jgi:magnesium transporter